MTRKPTYEELEQRIKELEKEGVERKRIEEAMKGAEQETRSILDTLVEHVIHEDATMKVLWANRSACESAGLTREQLLGRHCYEIWPQRQEPCPDCPVVKAMETGRPQEVEKLTPDGRAWFIRGYPMRDDKGETVGAVEVTLEITERKLAEEALRQSEQELALRNRIAQIFLTIPDEQMYGQVLHVILDALESKYGIFGYIDEHGLLVIPSMTRDIWEQCQVPDKTTVYPPETWGGIWGQSLREKRSLYANEGLRVPKGHVPIIRGLIVCINYGGKVIGLLEVANKATDYDDKDKAFLEAIADHIAPVLNARLQRDRQEKERNEAQEALIRLTYDLRKRVEELNCLYGISTLRENRSFSLEEILKGTVALIAPAWQYSEITCARIMLQGQEFGSVT